jgi:hypothetical protein
MKSLAILGLWLTVCAVFTGSACAQEVLRLPDAGHENETVLQRFSFASDGPIGPGWTRPDEIARTYFHEELPALFRRTIVLDGDVPAQGKLTWIFTGPHAGFTVELTSSKIRLAQRFYDSSALWSWQGNYPEKTVREDERQYLGNARDVTVVLDAHLVVQVLINGVTMLEQPCMFDVMRHQLMFSGPRNQHLTAAGGLVAPQIDTASVVIKPEERHQTMLGFGGSPSIPTYAELSKDGKKTYWEILRRYNLLLDREYPMGSELKQDLSNLDDLRDATPHYYGDNFPNGEVSDFDYSKHALAMGGDVIYEMWALPPWAQEAYTADGKPVMDAWGRAVQRAAKPDEYARIVVSFCRIMKQRTGKAPLIVGIQNEVEQPAAAFTAMAVTLRRELDKAGFPSTKIHMADASFMDMGVDRAKALRQNAAGWKAIDYTATHEYDYQEFFANPDMYDGRMIAMHDASGGKEFLATEICLNDPHYQEGSYRIALNVGQLYQKNLTELDAEALMYCWLLLDTEQPSFGGSRSLLVPDKTRGEVPIASSFQLRVLGAFSRHVLKGMIRVGAASEDNNLLTTAFAGNGHESLIVLNRSIEAKRLKIDWPGVKWTHIERTSQTEENVMSDSVPSEIVVRPGEIVTLSDFAVN